MHIDIKPEDVDAMVKDSILKSSLGKIIEKAIQDVTKAGSYNNPIEESLRKYIANLAVVLIEEKYQDSIKAAISNIIEKQVTQDLVDKTVETAMSKIVDAATRY